MQSIKKLANYILSLPHLPIYLCGHLSPDQDSICSCIALQRLLTTYKLDAKILLKQQDYSIIKWQNVDYKFYDNVQQKNYIFIALDVNDTIRLGDFKSFYDNATIKINIDHHSGNLTFADFVYSDSKSSSTCEIIYKLIEATNKSCLSLTTCQNLYAGIMTDTNCFTRRLTNKTLSIAQSLINKGVDYQLINSQTLWQRTKEEIICTGQLAKEIKDKKHFKYVVCDKSSYPFNQLSNNDLTKKVAEDLRKLDNLDIFVFLIMQEDKVVAKVMSKSKEIASDIACLFGGGGHKKEAGFTTSLSIKQIVNTIDNYLKTN